MMNVMHRNILHTGGMFSVRSKKNIQNPIDRFDGFLETLWWPGDSGRVKTRVSFKHPFNDFLSPTYNSQSLVMPEVR